MQCALSRRRREHRGRSPRQAPDRVFRPRRRRPCGPSSTLRFPNRSTIHRLAARSLIVAVSTFVALLVAEGAHRAWLAVHGTPHDPAAVRGRLYDVSQPLRVFVPLSREAPSPATFGALPILHPYTGAEFWPDTGDVLAHFRDPAEADTFELVIVGGSVASSFTDAEAARIEDALRALPELAGRRVKVLNYAHVAYKQPQQLNRITYLLLLGAHPEVVLNLDGFNEVALASEQASSGTNPLYPYKVVWGPILPQVSESSLERLEIRAHIVRAQESALGWVDRARTWRFDRSSLLSSWVFQRVEAYQRERQRLIAKLSIPEAPTQKALRQRFGPDFSADPDVVLETCESAWFEGSILLDAVCDRSGIQYLHALQPALFDEGSKPMSVEEEALREPTLTAWMSAPRVAYPHMRARSTEFANKGVDFVDASRVFEHVEEWLYRDPCHVNARGNELLREFLMPRILASARRAAAGSAEVGAAPR